ncbi:hypothetical protein NHG23_03375 [Aerococcaceae bacterium NML190073]|nr:hypothetical protein [Aerococcaceae bacterium NML190073]
MILRLLERVSNRLTHWDFCGEYIEYSVSDIVVALSAMTYGFCIGIYSNGAAMLEIRLYKYDEATVVNHCRLMELIVRLASGNLDKLIKELERLK